LETPDSKAKNLVISDRLRYNLIFTGLAILILLFFLLDLFLGSVSLKPKDVIDAIFNNTENIARTILVKFRLPKAITALSVGIALSISGLQMQTLFRNPMAGPYVLGISSGASLGVALVLLGFSSSMTPESIKAFGNWAIAGASWGGAGLVMILIMFISGRVKNILTVLILGIMLSSGIAAIVGILQYFSSETGQWAALAT
jgi:iron complex transport system permease protein